MMSIECINNCSIEEEQSESILSFSANTVTRTKGTVKSLTTSKVFNYVSANKGELYTNLKQTQENTNTYLYTYDQTVSSSKVKNIWESAGLYFTFRTLNSGIYLVDMGYGACNILYLLKAKLLSRNVTNNGIVYINVNGNYHRAYTTFTNDDSKSGVFVFSAVNDYQFRVTFPTQLYDDQTSSTQNVTCNPFGCFVYGQFYA